MTKREDGAALRELAQRVEQLVAAPHEIQRGVVQRLLQPVYRFLGWQAKFTSVRLRELLQQIATKTSIDDETFQKVLAETRDNIELAERAVGVNGYVPTAYASWLTRVVRTLQGIEALKDDNSPAAIRTLAGLDRTRVLPPLRIEKEKKERGPEEPEPEPTTKSPSRLLELQLAAIDHVMEAARGETRMIARRRRLLEGARRLLLDAAAALPLDSTGVAERQTFLATEISKLDRLQAAGIDPTVATLYQVRQALRRGDRDRLYAGLIALDSFALGVGDRSASSKTNQALSALRVKGGDTQDARQASLHRSTQQIFGQKVMNLLQQQAAAAHERLPETKLDPELKQLALDYLAPGTEAALQSALASVDGCFEVGAALSPVRVQEMEEVASLVRHPTQEMLLVQARGVEDVRDAIFDDPRSILLDLAAGRLLSRKFVERRQRPVERTRLVGEARIYVMDGSTSMLELGKGQARARMRDAILLAELATMLRRLEDPSRSVRVTLYYRFFTKVLAPLHRIQTPEETLAAMGEVVGTVRHGGTDIQSALLSSFELIRDAKRDDPDLARANIVLVTDGEAPVDGNLIRAARETAADVSINVSVIALGEENPVLRNLVARQRARGERAFYHFIDDDRLAAQCTGGDGFVAVHGVFASETFDPQKVHSALSDAVQELEDLEQARRPQRDDLDAAALDAATPLHDGALALEEATLRDARALERRFARWFPPPPKAPEQLRELTQEEAEDLDAVRIVLTTVAEVVGELTGDRMHRQADSVELIERLLQDARFTPARYLQFIELHGTRVAAEIELVHAASTSESASFQARLAASDSTRKRAGRR